MRDIGFHVVLGIDDNDDVRDGSVLSVLADIGITEVITSNHKGESALATYSKNKQQKLIDNIRISLGLDVLGCKFLPFYNVHGFDSDQRLIWVELCNQLL